MASNSVRWHEEPETAKIEAGLSQVDLEGNKVPGLETMERACLWFMPCVFLGLTANVMRSIAFGGWLASGLQYTVVVGFTVVLLLRKRLSPVMRIWVYCGVLLFFGLAGLVQWGLAGQGLLIVVFGLILASFYSVRLWIAVEVLAVIGTVSVATGFITGVLPVRGNTVELLRSPMAWATGIMTLNLAGGTALIAYRLTRELARRANALRISEQRFRDIFDASSDGILLLDATSGEVLDINHTVLDTYGLTRQDDISLSLSDITADLPEYSPARALDKLRTIREGKLEVFEWMAKYADGSPFPIEVVLKRTHVAGRDAILATVRDITEQKEAAERMRALEFQLQQAQKLEAVGQLAGGVAHDFNNLLQAILGYTTLTLESPDDVSVVNENLEEIQDAAKRAATLVHELLAFSRRQILEPVALDLNDVVEGQRVTLQRLLGDQIAFRLNAATGLGTVRADRGQVEQILMNLCLNARDAMPDGGSLTIETINTVLDDDYCQDHAWANPGAYVALTVRDTGCGMDKDVRTRAFEPFFTTKGPGEGSGLGLSMVYGIVRQHQGLLDLSSEPGQGTEFSIYFPRVAGEESRPEAEAPRS